ncbi:MAG: basic amino acid ABC transporter substrate-binding protein [Anaerolineaceae bacterium]|nr:basic amino acid ABC transporter substrate-binding protein [Anaerolineaceae bacterium]
MKRTTILLFTILILASILLAACKPAAPTAAKYTVATDATWPPFETVNESTKEVEGLDIDIMKAIAAKAGIELEFVNIPFDSLLTGLSQCQYDLAISSITITEERKQSMAFSDPYFEAGQIVVVAKDNADIQGKADLKGKKIGAQLGTTGEIEGKAISAEYVAYDTIDLAFLDVISGQLDAVISDNPLALGFVGQYPDKLKAVGEVFTDENYGIAVCNKKPDLVKKINEGLAAIKSDGELDKITEKWLGSK